MAQVSENMPHRERRPPVTQLVVSGVSEPGIRYGEGQGPFPPPSVFGVAQGSLLYFCGYSTRRCGLWFNPILPVLQLMEVDPRF